MTNAAENVNKTNIEMLFKAGAHFAFSKSRRHPTASPYIFGIKNKVEIFNLEKTETLLESAKEVIAELAKTGKTILFVGGKAEARGAITRAADSIDMPYVDGRWIGGTISNFEQIRKRVDKFLDQSSKKEKGELTKYTKKERLLIDREIEKLNRLFGGIVSLTKIPDAMFVVDARKEAIAVEEARKAGIKVIALCGSDNDLKKVDFPIVANDSSVASVNLIVGQIAEAYKKAKSTK